MGFLKELFEKKLKASTSISSRDYAYGGEEGSGGVARSAQSEWALPKLPSQKTAADPNELYRQLELESAGTVAADSVCYLQTQVQPSAKSFSFAAQRKQHFEQAEKVQAVQQANRQQCSSIKYDSINQFSQKVELYRGSVATVFKAVCIATNTKVIVKAYYKSKMHPKHYHKLHREIEAMKCLNGPYVTEFYAHFEDAQCVYIVMEFCEGGDLFKTMLMHGGLLDEQWVCIEVITPLLRILEKMHNMLLLHRDIKPENIFLTGMGKFKIGDFGLAIRFDKELAFSRSGTLDYMAPEVLKNSSVPFQEGKSVELSMLTSRGVKPYGPPVDVWAAGVLAYELVCGRPPFEVEDEAQTAALIMYSDAIKFPPNRSPQWCDFVKSTLVKNPEIRPTATALLKHPWIVTNLQRTLSEHARPSKEMLLQPLPLDLTQGPHAGKEFKRTLSCAVGSGGGSSSVSEQAPSSLPALPAGGVPVGPGAPSLPAAFPATPTGAARNMQHMHLGFGGERDRDGRSASVCGTGSRLSGLSASGTSSSDYSSSSSNSNNSHSAPGHSQLVQRSSGSGSGASQLLGRSNSSTAGGSGHSGSTQHLGQQQQLRDIQAELGDYERPEAAAGLTVSLPNPKVSFTGASSGSHLLSHLNPAAAAGGSGGSLSGSSSALGSPTGSPSSSSQQSPKPSTPSRVSAAGSPLKPAGLSMGLKVMLPPETDFELCGSSDSFCFSPNTPGPKPGIKERMKFYFQRQAGAGGGF